METKAPKLEPINLKDLKKAPEHARRETGNFEELKKNIEKNGIANPPVIARTENGTLYILDGDRRVKACLELGIDSLLCLVYEGLNEVEMGHLSYILNTERENLTQIEKALHIKRMMEKYRLTYTELEALGYGSQAQVSKFLGLLKLPSNTQEAIADGRLTVAHGTALLKAQNPEELTKIAIKKNWSAAKITKFTEALDKKQTQEIKIAPASGVTEGADTSKIGDGSVDFICSFLDPSAFDRANKLYFEYQISEVNRTLTDGGILALRIDNTKIVAPLIQRINNITTSFTLLTEFTVQIIPTKFENGLKKRFKNMQHANYKVQNDSHPILIFKKSGNRKVSPELTAESRLSEKEAVEFIRPCWTIEAEKYGESMFSRLIKMYSFKGDTVLDLFSVLPEFKDIVKNLGRRVLGDEKSEPAETVREYTARQQEELEANQPAKTDNESEEEDIDYFALAFGLGCGANVMNHA